MPGTCQLGTNKPPSQQQRWIKQHGGFAVHRFDGSIFLLVVAIAVALLSVVLPLALRNRPRDLQ